jgi:uncharacterized protein YjbJ (UPF0337 family)
MVMDKDRIASDADKAQGKLMDAEGKVAGRGRKQTKGKADMPADAVRGAYGEEKDAAGDMRDAGRRS